MRGNPLVFPYVKNWPKIAGDERNHGLGVIVLLEDKIENPLGSIDESNIRRWLAEYFGLADPHKIITIDDNRGIGKQLGLSFNSSFDKDYQKLVDFLLNPKYEDLGKGLEGHPLMVNLDAKRFQQAMAPKIEEAGYKINIKEF